jgi:hypothetical protein
LCFITFFWGAQEATVVSAQSNQSEKTAPSLPTKSVTLPPPLALRRPSLPDGNGTQFANPVDALVAACFSARGNSLPQVVPDAVFARRAYLDLWGLLPAPEQLEEFLSDPRADKRDRLIEQLLSHQKNYGEHWITFWNDLLRNDEGVVYHGTRESISTWLLKALESNLSYGRFVSALLNPIHKDDPKGFLVGVNWRGLVNASQTPAMQAAQNSAQVFLGVNLKCASCHDSFIDGWKLKDSYGMAGLFSEDPLELVRCDVKLGLRAEPKFLFPELGPISAATPAERRAEAARLFTTPENGRFARTLVNRIWKKLLGRGMVEPVDIMDGSAWDPDLLDWLASDFVDHGYDIKFLLRRIMTSQAYQLPAVLPASDRETSYVFKGPLLRRLTAEQFLDAVSSVTGEWRTLRPKKAEPGAYSRDWRLKSTALTRALGRPIRDQVFTDRNTRATTLQALELINGDELAYLLHRGALRLLNELKPPPANLFDSGLMTSGKASVDIDISGLKQLWLLIEDVDSYDRERVTAGWAEAELTGPDGRTRLVDLKTDSQVRKQSMRMVVKRPIETREDETKYETTYHDYPEALTAPVPSTVVYDIAGKGYTRFRAVAGVDESSMRDDIGPRIRFFVFSERPDMRQLIRVAGDLPVAMKAGKFTERGLVAYLYRAMLGREPSAGERAIARDFLKAGSAPGKISPEGLEDLLWSLFLSPEFQFIR